MSAESCVYAAAAGLPRPADAVVFTNGVSANSAAVAVGRLLITVYTAPLLSATPARMVPSGKTRTLRSGKYTLVADAAPNTRLGPGFSTYMVWMNSSASSCANAPSNAGISITPSPLIARGRSLLAVQRRPSHLSKLWPRQNPGLLARTFITMVSSGRPRAAVSISLEKPTKPKLARGVSPAFPVAGSPLPPLPPSEGLTSPPPGMRSRFGMLAGKVNARAVPEAGRKRKTSPATAKEQATVNAEERARRAAWRMGFAVVVTVGPGSDANSLRCISARATTAAIPQSAKLIPNVLAIDKTPPTPMSTVDEASENRRSRRDGTSNECRSCVHKNSSANGRCAAAAFCPIPPSWPTKCADAASMPTARNILTRKPGRRRARYEKVNATTRPTGMR